MLHLVGIRAGIWPLGRIWVSISFERYSIRDMFICAKGYGGAAGHPQQYMSISGSHASEVHLQVHNVELEKEVHRPEFIGRNVTVRRDYKEHRKEKEEELND